MGYLSTSAAAVHLLPSRVLAEASAAFFILSSLGVEFHADSGDLWRGEALGSALQRSSLAEPGYLHLCRPILKRFLLLLAPLPNPIIHFSFLQ